MRPASILLLAAAVTCSSGIVDDLQLIGVPATAAEVSDSMLVVSMGGSLAEGDSLLKHYGGVFFTLVDSIAGGWSIYGVRVQLEEADLVFRRCDMIRMLTELTYVSSDDVIADWVLSNTQVVRGRTSL